VARAAAARAAVARVRVVALMAAAEMVVEVARLMGATRLIEGWAVARQKRARMQRRAARSSRR
jgi:hypothetical protein